MFILYGEIIVYRDEIIGLVVGWIIVIVFWGLVYFCY